MNEEGSANAGEGAGPMERSRGWGLATPVIVGAICVALALVAMWAMGHRPGEVWGIVWEKVIWPASGERRIASWSFILQQATPLVLTGLAIMVAFRASVWNIGAQGQYLAGALGATIFGAYWHLTGTVAAVVPLIAAMIGGAGLGALASLLEWRRRVPLVLSTLLLNFIMVEVVRYLLQGPMREPGGQVKSRIIVETARLPLIGGTQIHVGLVMALMVAAAVAMMLRRSTFGFRLRVVGENPTAARFAGIHVPGVALMTMAISGALAGLAGGVQITGVTHELLQSSGGEGFGFTGIAVALLGRLTAGGVVAAAIFFGVLARTFTTLQAEMDVPYVAGQAIQGLIILMMLVFGQSGVRGRFKRLKRFISAGHPD